MSTDKIQIGILGCGKQAPKHLQGLTRIPGVEIVLADTNAAAAKSMGGEFGLQWTSEPGEILEDPAVHAILICTPTTTHTSLIRKAIDCGKDFFCEKPLTDSLEEAIAIADLVERERRIGMIGYVYRFVPVFELGKRLFEDVHSLGESMVLGRPVASFFRLGGRGSHQEWKHKKATHGGAVNEMLVHMVDLAVWYFGSVEQAEFLAKEILRPLRVINGRLVEADAEDYVVVRLKMLSGVEVLCQADLVTPCFTQLVEIQGDNGTFMGSIQQDMPSFVFCSEPRAGYKAGQTEVTFGPHNVFEAQMAEFVRSLKLGTPPSKCTVRDSVLIMEALEKLRIGGNG